MNNDITLTSVDGIVLVPGDRVLLTGTGPKQGYVRVRVFGREYDIPERLYARWLWGRGWRGDHGVYVVRQVYNYETCHLTELRPL